MYEKALHSNLLLFTCLYVNGTMDNFFKIQ
jgi:hypothetical protein